MTRITKKTNRFEELDLTIPVNEETIMSKVDEADCFGKAWDLRTHECSSCHERDVCGIIFNSKVVKPKVAKVQEKQGAIFLDLSDFENVTKDLIFDFVDSGVTPVKDLLVYVMALAKTSDKVAGVGFLRRFIKSTDGINTKKGIVWIA